MGKLAYVHLPAGTSPPRLELSGAWKAVVIVEQDVKPDWQALVSRWIVSSGCLYMMAWGLRCSEWDDSVDFAMRELFNFGDVSDDDFVMTTWHDGDPMSEVFWYSEHAAFHPTLGLDTAVIIDISPREREADLRRAYADAQGEEA